MSCLIQPAFCIDPVVLTDINTQDIVTKAINELKVCNQYNSDYFDKRYHVLSLNRLTEIAVAMDKCKTLNIDSCKEITTQLTDKDPNGMKWLKGIQKLLKDDTTGLEEIFGNERNEPSHEYMKPAINIVSQNGYTLATNALITMKRDLFAGGKERIIAWMSIPADKRPAVDKIMLMRYPVGDRNRTAFIDLAIDLYKKPPVDGFLADDYFNFATWLGKDTINFSTVYTQYWNQIPKIAIKLAKWLAKENINDTSIQQKAAEALIVFRAPSKEIIAIYQEAMVKDNEPYLRDCRIKYFETLKNNILVPDNETLESIQREKDLLRAGDAYLVDAQYDKASAKFHSMLIDDKIDIYHRSAAWSGLLDSDPAKAMENTEKLFTDVEKIKDIEARGRLVVWLGWQLNRVVNREVPMLTGSYKRLQYIPIHDIKDWQKQLAVYMENLLKIDAVACLKPGKDYTPSLRYTAALLYALAWDNKKASEIAKREIKYMVPPPTGKWEFDPRNRDLDLNKPREEISPRDIETELLMQELMPALMRYNVKMQTSPTEPINMPLPNLELMNDQSNIINKCKDKENIKTLLKAFGEQFYLSITYIDPKRTGLRTDQPAPPTREVNMEMMKSQHEYVNAAFNNDLACHYAPYFLRVGDTKYSNEFYGGMLKAMFTASNPALLKEMVKLTEEVLDKYQKVEGPEKAAIEAENIANYITARRIYDMSEYAKELHERYPKPEVKK